MGTRNLTKVIDKDGVVRVAQYGQWDGYPDGQGLTALYHLASLKQIEAGLARVRWATQDELDAINNLDGWARGEFSLKYPNLSRDTCADILAVVAYSIGEVILVDESEFENDALFCEGVYTVDFQQRKFISWYQGKTVVFGFDDLPSREEYIETWDKVLYNVGVGV